MDDLLQSLSLSSLQASSALYGSNNPLLSSSSSSGSDYTGFFDSIADSYISSLGLDSGTDTGLYTSQGILSSSLFDGSSSSIAESLLSLGDSSAQSALASLASLDTGSLSGSQLKLMMEVNRMSVSASASLFGGSGNSSGTAIDLFG